MSEEDAIRLYGEDDIETYLFGFGTLEQSVSGGASCAVGGARRFGGKVARCVILGVKWGEASFAMRHGSAGAKVAGRRKIAT